MVPFAFFIVDKKFIELHNFSIDLVHMSPPPNDATFIYDVISDKALSIHGKRYPFYRVLVNFYCNAITRSRLQLINTLIDTFFL